jgi:hypothetical protein
LDKTGEFTLIGGVKEADRDPVFEELPGLVRLLPLRTRSMVSPAKAGSWADGQELFPDGGGNTENRPGDDNLIGIDFFPDAVGWFKFDDFAFHYKRGLWSLRHMQGIFPFPGYFLD